MTALKENTELQSKVDEDEDDIDSLTEKNRQLVKQVCAVLLDTNTQWGWDAWSTPNRYEWQCLTHKCFGSF